MQTPDYDGAFQRAIEQRRSRHRVKEDDTVMLLLELFRVHQDHWDGIRGHGRIVGIPQNDRKAEREYEDLSKQRGHRYTPTAAKGGHEETKGRGRGHRRDHGHIVDFGHGPIAREILPLRQPIAAREFPRRDQRAFSSAPRAAGRPRLPLDHARSTTENRALVTSDIRSNYRISGSFRLRLDGGVALRLHSAICSFPPSAALLRTPTADRSQSTKSSTRSLTFLLLLLHLQFGAASVQFESTAIEQQFGSKWRTCLGRAAFSASCCHPHRSMKMSA